MIRHRVFLKTLLIFIVIIVSAHPVAARQVVLNEIMASNTITITDNDGDFSDWVELFNQGNDPVNLAGYGLSDDELLPFKWVFPEVTVGSGEFLLIWASNKDRRLPGEPLHTNFAISASGEEVLITAPDGSRIDMLNPVTLPADISLGRQPDGTGDWLFFEVPTPGEPNTGSGFTDLLGPVVFSHQGGFYTSDITLTLGSSGENVRIVYTTDGSEPDENAIEYTVPITITDRSAEPNGISMIPTNFMEPDSPDDVTFREAWREPGGPVAKGSVIRARALRSGARSGEVVTRSYFVWPEGGARYDFPVFSISADPADFFDAEKGIYVPGNYNNMFQRGPEWERPVHIEFWESDGSLAFSQGAGARIHGGTTRSRPRKSLRLYAREEYGTSWFEYPLFPGKPVDRYKRFLLRNSGNDWSESVFRDAFMQSLLKGSTRLDIQDARPAIVFLNGEYWGIHWIRDRLDDHYLSTHYGVEEHEMTMAENNRIFDRGDPTGLDHFEEMWDFISNPNNPMVQQINFENVRTYIDTENFRDHFMANIFFGNTDWPGNHQLYWRKNVPYNPDNRYGHDGRWRWMIFDTDFGFWLNFFYVTGNESGPAHNTLAFALQEDGPDWPNPAWSTNIFRQLMTNQGFRNGFINRFADMLNTAFSADHVLSEIERFAGLLDPEMDEHISRWGRPLTKTDWMTEVDRMRDYGSQREGFLRQYIRQQFLLAGEADLTINLTDDQAGRVQVNTILIDPETPGIGDDFANWQGRYFRGIPVTLSAIPKYGYRFVEWNGDIDATEASITITLIGDVNLVPVFEVDDTVPADPMHPLPHKLSEDDYIFGFWSPDEPEGSFPTNMVFQQSAMDDPGLNDMMTEPYNIPESDYNADDLPTRGFPYNNTRRTRINGLGEGGVSFINTGRGRDLGAAVLALDTRTSEQARISWTGSTVVPASRVYAIRLQYRVGTDGDFTDVTGSDGEPVEYMRSAVTGHEQRFESVHLPQETLDQPYVQLRWKYYFTGERLSTESGARDELRLDNIVVTATPGTSYRDEPAGSPREFRLEQNYPNPFNPATVITFMLPEPATVRLAVYDGIGREVALIAVGQYSEGRYDIRFDASRLSSGIYFYQIRAVLTNGTEHRRTRNMVLVK
ncbi:MAG: CotH kinase family protein [Cyclonatronaceae bacterium]